MLLKVIFDDTPLVPSMEPGTYDEREAVSLPFGTTLLVLEHKDYPGGTYYHVLSPEGPGWVYQHNVAPL